MYDHDGSTSPFVKVVLIIAMLLIGLGSFEWGRQYEREHSQHGFYIGVR